MLQRRQQSDLVRQRYPMPSSAMISFASSDYLSLRQHPDIITAFKLALDKYGVGSGGSALVSGYHIIHQQVEQAFSQFFQRDRALLFPSGYSANLAVITALATKGDSLFADKSCHASIHDGAHLSAAPLYRYNHHDLWHLQHRLQQSHQGQAAIISEGVFSMDGSMAAIPELAAIAKSHHANLIIDDAHGVGVLGDQGGGSCQHFKMTQSDVPLLICPLGKAFASQGAVVVGREDLIESIIQFARPYIYSTSVLPTLAASWLTTLKVVQQAAEKRQQLQLNIQYFKKAAEQRGLSFLASDTALQCHIVGNAATVLDVQQHLKAYDFYVAAIRPPTVRAGQSLLRFSLNADHGAAMIDDCLDCLVAYYKQQSSLRAQRGNPEVETCEQAVYAEPSSASLHQQQRAVRPAQ